MLRLCCRRSNTSLEESHPCEHRRYKRGTGSRAATFRAPGSPGTVSLACKTTSGSELLCQPEPAARITGNFLRQELECNEAVQAGVLGLVDDTHTGAAQLLDDAVMRNGQA